MKSTVKLYKIKNGQLIPNGEMTVEAEDRPKTTIFPVRDELTADQARHVAELQYDGAIDPNEDLED